MVEVTGNGRPMVPGDIPDKRVEAAVTGVQDPGSTPGRSRVHFSTDQNMKAKLLKEQMGVPAGTEMEVLETGRAWTLRAPSGADIVVPACDVEMVPDTEPEVDPKDPGLLVNIFGGQPQPEAERTLLDDERDVDVFPQAEPVEDDHDPKWEDSRDEASDPQPDDEDAVGTDDAVGEEE